MRRSLSSPRGRRSFSYGAARLGALAPRPRKLRLELLESRCLLTTYYTVDSLDDAVADDGQITLREALQAANTDTAVHEAEAGSGHDVIRFDSGLSGTITLNHALGQLVISSDLDLLGEDAPDIILDAQGNSRVLYVDATVTDAKISDLTITGGSAVHSGGGILNEGTLTVTTSTISDNSADLGGGIFSLSGSTLTVTNSTISGNSADHTGGGISNEGELTVTNSTISENSAYYGGGGIYGSGTLTVTNSTISDNEAVDGGGILNLGWLTITNSTISGNSAGWWGGGIHSGGTLTVTNSTISDNSAGYDGGGIDNRGGTLTVTNSTIVENTADAADNTTAEGGGVYTEDGGSTTLHNTIVAGNHRGTDGLADDLSGDPIQNASSHNLVSELNAGDGLDPTKGNIVVEDELSSWLAPLGDYGGPTRTHAPAAGSPAINAGSNDIAQDPNGDGDDSDQLTTDQRGEGFHRIVGGTVDIGAFEVEVLTLPWARNDSFTVAEDSQYNDLDVFENDLISDDPTAEGNISQSEPPNQGGTVVFMGLTTLLYTPAANFFGTETFEYLLSDGVGTPEEAVVTVTVTGEPDPPVANDDGGAKYTTDEDTLLTTGNVLANDTDADGDTLSVTSIDTTGTVGEVTDNGDGTFNYDPQGQFDSLRVGESDTDTFTYTVSDGNGGTDTGTVTIHVNGVNDPPVANDDSGPGFETDQNTPFLTENVLTNDTDAEDDPLSITGIDTTLTAGEVTDEGDGTFDYDPNGQFESLGLGETETDSFTYTVSDGEGGSDTAVVTITVVGWNDPPEASDDSGTGFTTDEDSDFVTANVLTNDSDTDGGTLSVVSIDTTGTFGQVTDNGDGTFNYDPLGLFEVLGTGESETDRFDYTLGDGQDGFDTATVWITINGINDAPIASNDSGLDFTTDQDTAFVTGNVLPNDWDAENDTLSILSIDTTGTKGLITNNHDGTFDYDPNGEFDSLGVGETATDSFTYTVSDGNGGTDTATVTITINGLNDVPIAQNGSFGTDEDTPINDTLANLASDPDANDSLTFSAGASSTLGAAVRVNPDGTFRYDPSVSDTLNALAIGETATDKFIYAVDDGNDGRAGAEVTITVTGVNDPPVANHDSGQGFRTDHDAPLVTANVLANDTDADGDQLSITSFDTSGTWGKVTHKGDGTFRYDPDGKFDFLGPGVTATDSFTYTLSDGNGGTDTATVTIAIRCATASYSGFVYADTNLNHRPDEHEGLPGVLITLTGRGISAQTWTDDHGWYEFRDLPGGRYTIVERQPQCMIDGGGNTLRNVTVAAAQSTVGQNFRELGLKPGYVFNRLYATPAMPIGSKAWRETCKQVVKYGQEDAGHSPSSPPPVPQQILQRGSEIVLTGTNGDDRFEFVAAGPGQAGHSVTLNGETHRFDASVVRTIRFDGGLGLDVASIIGSLVADQLTASAKSASLKGSDYLVQVTGTEETTVAAGQGTARDVAALGDSPLDDTLEAEIGSVRLSAYCYDAVFRQFEEITALSQRGGHDRKAIAEAIDYDLTAEGPWIEL